MRAFEAVLAERVFDQLAGVAPQRPTFEMYRELSGSDQGVIREFYLTQIEEVPVELRTKYLKLYRYQ